MWFWTRANLPEEYTVQLKTILEKYFTRFPYYPPFKEAICKRDWSPPNIVTKDILKEDSSWKALSDLFPRTANGLTVKRNGVILQDPIHGYLRLMRILMVWLISWSQESVDQRDDMCCEATSFFWTSAFPCAGLESQFIFFGALQPPAAQTCQPRGHVIRGGPACPPVPLQDCAKTPLLPTREMLSGAAGYHEACQILLGAVEASLAVSNSLVHA